MKILVVKLSSLGDLFHALPCVRALKAGLGAEIHWLAQGEYAELVRCFTDVDRVLTFHRRAFFRRLRPFLRALRAERYDCVVDLQGLLKSAVAGRLARAGVRVGPSFSREGARLLYTAVAGPPDRDRHAVDQALDVLAHFGLPRPAAPEFPVAFPARDPGGSRPRIAVAPVSRWATKNWPRERFAELIARLQARPGATIYLLGGPADREAADAIARAAGGRPVNLAGALDLVGTGSLLQAVDLLIANDSGPVHMAAAVGTPALVLFGPTNPRRTGPYGPGHRVIQAARDCVPCYSGVCRTGDTACMQAIAVDEVERAAQAMLAGRAAR